MVSQSEPHVHCFIMKRRPYFTSDIMFVNGIYVIHFFFFFKFFSLSHLVWTAVLYNLCTQVATFDGAQVLLVGLPITVVLVQHVRGPRLCLRLNDGIPQLLGLDRLPSFAFLFISDQKTSILRCFVFLTKLQ